MERTLTLILVITIIHLIIGGFGLLMIMSLVKATYIEITPTAEETPDPSLDEIDDIDLEE